MPLWYPPIAVQLQRAGQACCRDSRLREEQEQGRNSRLPAPDSHFQALLDHLGWLCTFSLLHVTLNINVCHRMGEKVPQDKDPVSSNCPRGMLHREAGKDLAQQGTPKSTPS